MKRINSLLLFILGLFLVSSCSFNSKANSISLTLPLENTTDNRNRAPATSATYKFTLKLEDYNAEIHEKTAASGETVVFNEIPLGPASLEITGFNSENKACYYGKTDFEVYQGENKVSIKLTKIAPNEEGQGGGSSTPEGGSSGGGNTTPEGGSSGGGEGQSGGGTTPEGGSSGGGDPETPGITITINANGTTSEFSKKDSTTAAQFLTALQEKQTASETTYKKVYCWYDSVTDTDYDFATETAVTTYLSGITEATTLTGKYGVPITVLKEYLSNEGTGAQDNEEIIVLNDTSTTKIPNFSFGSPKYTGIILDFSKCTSVTSVDTNAITGTNTSNRWASVVKLPSTMTSIGYLQGVTDKIYIPSSCNLKFIASMINSNSTYSLYYGGTLADWCEKVSYLNTYYDQVPVHYLSENGKELYLMVNGVSTNIIGNGTVLDIESQYTDTDGTKKDLTSIAKYSFRHLKCNTITIPNTVEMIGESAFAFSDATTVNIPNGIKRIDSGAFFYAGSSPRIINYDGTIDDWMKVGCVVHTEEGEGGPFLAKKTSLYLKSGSSYVPAYDTTGTLEFTVYKSTTTKGNSSSYFGEISGQLQGLQGLKDVIINGTPEEDQKFTVENYAFYNCSDLEKVTIAPAMEFGNKVFANTVLRELHLNSATKSTCSSTTFSGTSGVVVHVPASLYSSYRSDTNWKNNVDIETIVTLKVNESQKHISINNTSEKSIFNLSDSDIPSGKSFVYYIDKNGKTWDFSDSSVTIDNFLDNFPPDGELTAVFEFDISNIYSYLSSDVVDNERIVLTDSGSVTSLNISSIKSGVNGITLDLSKCTSLTTFEMTPSNQIVSIIFPTSIDTISGIKNVKQSIYIPYTDIIFGFGENTYDDTTTYEITFGGTIADWCAKSDPEATNFPSKYLKYCLDDSGKQINVQASHLKFSQKLSDGITNLNNIPPYAFANLPCSSDCVITIPSSVSEIGKFAFYNVNSKNIEITPIEMIRPGAFYTSDNSTRSISFYGSLSEWFKIQCPLGSTDANEFGPLYGFYNLYVYEDSTYKPIIENDIVTLDYQQGGDLNIQGQIQGLRGFNKLIIQGNMSSVSISANAFYGCTDLEIIYIYCNNITLDSDSFADLEYATIYMPTTIIEANQGLLDEISDRLNITFTGL